MNILGISCSPRKKGNTEILVREVLKGARSEGADVKFYSIAGKDIRPCDGCRSCSKTGLCKIKDDMQDLYKLLLEADGVVFGTPVYFYSMTAQAKAVIDRIISFTTSESSLANKVGGVVAVAGSLGLVSALKDLYFFFVTRQMIPANYVAVYGGGKGDVIKMEQGMKAAWELGQQMVKIALQGFKYPPGLGRVHIAYGTHTH